MMKQPLLRLTPLLLPRRNFCYNFIITCTFHISLMKEFSLFCFLYALFILVQDYEDNLLLVL